MTDKIREALTEDSHHFKERTPCPRYVLALSYERALELVEKSDEMTPTQLIGKETGEHTAHSSTTIGNADEVEGKFW